MMLTLLAFVGALALLIAVHEYGHYRVAVACGVKVLRFSIGFGPVLVSWTSPKTATEYVLSALPLGGYVKMLDEREGEVAVEERVRAFNTQPLRKRVAIVAAGPLANLLLAVILYAAVNWTGVEQPKAVLASPVAGSLAQRAGVVGGEWVVSAQLDGDEAQAVVSFDDLRWLATQGMLDGRDLRLGLASSERAVSTRDVVLRLSELPRGEPDAQMFLQLGLAGPFTQPVIGQVVDGSPAQRAGLQSGDRVLAVGAMLITDGQQLRAVIRGLLKEGGALTVDWRIERAGVLRTLSLTPEVKHDESGAAVARIGAFVGAPPDMLTVRYGLLEGVWLGVVRTWDVSALSLRMMGRMVTGQASLKNLSGPLTIADYAGKSASLGWTPYLVFLALISVSLGVLNLLPLPMLDGGHLMYYLWEGLTGRSVTDVWMERLQRGGVAVLLMMMSIALFNDVTRLLG